LYRQTEQKSVTPVTLWSNGQNYSPSARLNCTPRQGYITSIGKKRELLDHWQRVVKLILNHDKAARQHFPA
jgi:hypothetical protein